MLRLTTSQHEERGNYANSRCSVNKNQQSPLLRLPPEIRNKIWTIALGDMIFIPNRDWFARPYLWVAANPPRNHRLALLRTCRQVFCETALIPYKINTFIVPRYIKLRSFLRRMKTAHRRAVSTLQVEHSMSYGNPLTHVPLLSLLTGLERLKVVVTGYSNNVQNERYLSALKDQLSDLKASGASLEVSIDYQETIAYRNWYASL